jgi:hypothetical protein
VAFDARGSTKFEMPASAAASAVRAVRAATPSHARVLEVINTVTDAAEGVNINFNVEFWAHVGFCLTGVISSVLINWGELHGMRYIQSPDTPHAQSAPRSVTASSTA